MLRYVLSGEAQLLDELSFVLYDAHNTNTERTLRERIVCSEGTLSPDERQAQRPQEQIFAVEKTGFQFVRPRRPVRRVSPYLHSGKRYERRLASNGNHLEANLCEKAHNSLLVTLRGRIECIRNNQSAY